MDELSASKKQFDFGSLTGIMEHFANVPYEQFQKELNDWFYKSLSEKGIDLQQMQASGFTNLPDLISLIYHEAELKQLLYDKSITDEQSNNQI